MNTTLRPAGDTFLQPGGALAGPLGRQLLAGLPAPATEPGEGDRIGPFRLERELGRGGMGRVFLARRADGAFDQVVALKWLAGLPAGVDSDDLLARERALLAGLDHPGIARLIDGGREREGGTWFAMEYVDGLRLDQHAEARQLGLRARIALMLPLCQAVGFAHRRLVIHRDLKPANVMVDREGRPKLLDFGIAGLIDAPEQAPQALTPAWASPEQARGEALTTASDIYQLGLILAAMAAPEVPPIALLHGAAGLDDRDLRAILQRACTALPEQRYASTEALAADLEAWLELRPVQARGGGALYRFGRLLRRQRLASAAVFGGLLALVGLSVALGLQRDIALQQASRAEREAALAQRESERSAAALGFLGELLGKAQPGEHRGRIPTVEDALAAGAERLREDSAMPPGLRGALLARLGSIRIERSEFGQAKELLEQALPLLENDAADPVALAEAEGDLAYTLDYSDWARALPMFDRAIERLAALPGQQLRRLRMQRMRASLLFGIGRYADAVQALRAHLQESDAELGVDSIESGMGRVLLAMSLNVSGDIDGGLQAAQQAWATLKAALGAAHPRSVQAGNAYASALYNHRRYAEQGEVLEELLDTARLLWGEQHPRYALLLTWQGAGLLEQGRAGEAAAVLERGAAIYDAADPADDLGSPNTLGALGDAYAALGRPEQALETYARMLARERERTTALPPDGGGRALKPARLLVALGRKAEAAAALDEVAARAARVGGMGPILQAEFDALRARLDAD